jgi:hypothetical protein
MSCSAPNIFGFRAWFEKRFKDLCDIHDEEYLLRLWKRKVSSDFSFCAAVASRGYCFLAYASFIYFVTLGTVYWLWKKHKHIFKK